LDGGASMHAADFAYTRRLEGIQWNSFVKFCDAADDCSAYFLHVS
jgi:hypothetical protein